MYQQQLEFSHCLFVIINNLTTSNVFLSLELCDNLLYESRKFDPVILPIHRRNPVILNVSVFNIKSTFQTNLLNDMLDVVDLEGRLTSFEKRVGDFDLIWDDGPIHPTSDTTEGWLINALNTINPFNSENSSESVHVFGPNGLPRLNSFLGCTSRQSARYKLDSKC